MYYFDTCFLTPLILEESTSVAVEAFMSALPTEDLATSHWTKVEFSSLVAREVRMGGLDREGAAKAENRFETLVNESFTVLLPTAEDFDMARTYLRCHETGLRGGDALHLAIAGVRRAKTIFSLDKGMVKAGATLGLPVGLGIDAPA